MDDVNCDKFEGHGAKVPREERLLLERRLFCNTNGTIAENMLAVYFDMIPDQKNRSLVAVANVEARFLSCSPWAS